MDTGQEPWREGKAVLLREERKAAEDRSNTGEFGLTQGRKCGDLKLVLSGTSFVKVVMAVTSGL